MCVVQYVDKAHCRCRTFRSHSRRTLSYLSDSVCLSRPPSAIVASLLMDVLCGCGESRVAAGGRIGGLLELGDARMVSRGDRSIGGAPRKEKKERKKGSAAVWSGVHSQQWQAETEQRAAGPE